MKETKMNTFKNLSCSFFVTCLTVGSLGLLAPVSSYADGKGASKLMFNNAPQVVAQPAAATVAMSCPRCKDGYTKVASPAKGLRAEPTRRVATHLCPACSTKITSVGAGKAKTDKVTHSCGMENSCCVAAK